MLREDTVAVLRRFLLCLSLLPVFFDTARWASIVVKVVDVQLFIVLKTLVAWVAALTRLLRLGMERVATMAECCEVRLLHLFFWVFIRGRRILYASNTFCDVFHLRQLLLIEYFLDNRNPPVHLDVWPATLGFINEEQLLDCVWDEKFAATFHNLPILSSIWVDKVPVQFWVAETASHPQLPTWHDQLVLRRWVVHRQLVRTEQLVLIERRVLRKPWWSVARTWAILLDAKGEFRSLDGGRLES